MEEMAWTQPAAAAAADALRSRLTTICLTERFQPLAVLAQTTAARESSISKPTHSPMLRLFWTMAVEAAPRPLLAPFRRVQILLCAMIAPFIITPLLRFLLET